MPMTPLPMLDLLRCPRTGRPLEQEGGELVAAGGAPRYRISESGIPLFAEQFCSPEGRAQQQHYDRIAKAYMENLGYAHTREYSTYLDRVFFEALGEGPLGEVAEICCGRGEAFHLVKKRVGRGVGVDVSLRMLEAARRELPGQGYLFLQADATSLPLADGRLDHVLMLGGIHHVNDRGRLFSEIFRVLKPGGRFLWREPVSDFILWRMLRALVYRLSPTLDHRTERPLLHDETVPPLRKAGFVVSRWRTCGLLGFCLLMNSDVLIVNRWLRFVPGIRALARLMARFDELLLKAPGLSRAGLLVVGEAIKPEAGRAVP